MDISNTVNLNHLFKNCKSLLYLPDISIWNTSNVTNMCDIFRNCCSLLYLPNIAIWDLNSIETVDEMLCNCSSLLIKPDLSKWSNYVSIQSVFDSGVQFDIMELLDEYLRKYSSNKEEEEEY